MVVVVAACPPEVAEEVVCHLEAEEVAVYHPGVQGAGVCPQDGGGGSGIAG